MDGNINTMMIDEPLKQYDYFKEKHKKNIDKYFDNLVANSKINIQENKTTVQKINNLSENIRFLKSKIFKRKSLIIMHLVFMFISLIAFLVSIYYLFVKRKNSENPEQILKFAIPMLVLSVMFIVLNICLIFLFHKKKIKLYTKELEKDTTEKSKFIDQAYEQTKGLCSLFKHGMKEKIFRETLPFIELDRFFDNSKLDRMIKKYGFEIQKNENLSTIYVQSGQIKGIPFLILSENEHKMGEKEYKNSIVIHWTTGSGEKIVSHTQTLVAKIVKPCPYYYKNTSVYFGSNAAPKLSFVRKPNHLHTYNEKSLNKFINNGSKALAKSKTLTLGNDEFEVIFNTKYRNEDEVGYRLLFTPLAQKNLKDLILDNEKGYGDDFEFEKDHKLNCIVSEHLQTFSIHANEEIMFKLYDYDEIEKAFKDFNFSYFKHLYFAFAPFFAIPIYSQTLPSEYIYRDIYNTKPKLNNFEYENILNGLKFSALDVIHPNSSQTKNIINTKFIQKNEDSSESVLVNSWGYEIIKRVENVQIYGGDGLFHTIPVEWDEYIRVDKQTKVSVMPIDEYHIDEEKWNQNITSKKIDLSNFCFSSNSSLVAIEEL